MTLDETEFIVWTPEDVTAFFTACDHLDKVIRENGGGDEEVDAVLSLYFFQRREQKIEPEKVLDRMALAAERRLSGKAI